MYGMTREEAANKALALGELKLGLAKVRAYLDSTVGEGNADEILRPVEWALDERPKNNAADRKIDPT